MFKRKGILIVFEGISGCGKSENAESLRRYLVDKGYKVCVIEWNSNKLVRKIVAKIHSHNILTSGVYSFFQWVSFLIDYLFKIIPLLKRNYILIADRYVYTGLTRDCANGAGRRLGNLLHRIVIKPDIVFFNDIHPQICHERIKKRGKILFHTNKAILRSMLLKNKQLYYLMKLRREYLRLFNNNSVIRNTNIIFINDNSGRINEYIDDYISAKKSI